MGVPLIPRCGDGLAAITDKWWTRGKTASLQKLQRGPCEQVGMLLQMLPELKSWDEKSNDLQVPP